MVFHYFGIGVEVKQQAILMLLVFVVPLAGGAASAAENSVDVDGVWGISEEGTAGQGVNCDRWASGPAGAAGAISDTDPGIQNQVTGDENQIRYGAQDVNDDPPPCHVFKDQSGFGFDGVDGSDIPRVGSPFKLGVFTHYNSVTNIDLADYNPLENVALTLTLSGGVNAVLKSTVEIVETANDDDPCRFQDAPNDPPCGERISIVPDAQHEATFEIDGLQYGLQISGFADCDEPGSPNRIFYTHEMAADQACLYASLVVAKVDVDGVWGVSEQGTAGEGANCDRWASGRGSSAGAVSDDDPRIQDEATNDANHIRYGAADVNRDPPPCLGFADQSGFAFWGESGVSLPTDGSSFLLGEFTHYNTTTNGDLADYNPLENVGLTIRLSGGVEGEFQYIVRLFETVNEDDEALCKFPEAPNNPTCGEKVSIDAQPLQSSAIDIGGEQYTLDMLGFTNCSETATPNTVLYTREMAIDVACVYARLVAIQSIG
jgi:hypothetical protein